MNPMRSVILPMLLTLLFASVPSWAVESGTLLYAEVIREKPKASAKVLASIEKGTKVRIVSQKDDWFRVTINDEWVGWIPKKALRRHDATFGAGVKSLNSVGGVPTNAFGGGASSMQAAPSTGGK